MAGSGCGQHPHYHAGCFRCRVVDSAYGRRRKQAIAAGTWQYAVPAADVLAHIRQLRASGMKVTAIARASGIQVGTLRTMVYGQPKMVTGPTAAAILAAQPAPMLKAGHVPAVVTVRQIRALVAGGYSLAHIGEQTGKPTNRIWALAQGTRESVAEETAQTFADLYDRLALIPGPSSRARDRAKRLGWHPPEAWTDIDNPDAEPYADGDDFVDAVRVDKALAGEPVSLSPLERHHAVHVGVDRGMSFTAIAERIRTSHTTAKTLAAQPLPAGFELVA